MGLITFLRYVIRFLFNLILRLRLQPRLYFDDLPQDIISEILFRTPVTSVLQYKAVSKGWNTLLSSPEFESGYYKHNSGDGIMVYFENRFSFEEIQFRTFLYHMYDYSIASLVRRCPPNGIQPALFFTAYCNGLVAVENIGVMGSYRLWNPRRREMNDYIHASIAFEEYIQDNLVSDGFRTSGLRCAGLFCSPTTNDEYNLVIFVADQKRDHLPFFVLNFNTGQHRMLKQNGLSIEMPIQKDGVVVNGLPHWATSHGIYAFDPKEEAFVVMTVPTTSFGAIQGIGALQGKLTVTTTPPDADVQIWRLMNYHDSTSWEMQFAIPDLFYVSVRPLHLVTSLFIGLNIPMGRLIFYNFEDGVSWIEELGPGVWEKFCMLCESSLISPKRLSRG